MVLKELNFNNLSPLGGCGGLERSAKLLPLGMMNT